MTGVFFPLSFLSTRPCMSGALAGQHWGPVARSTREFLAIWHQGPPIPRTPITEACAVSCVQDMAHEAPEDPDD